MKKKLEKALYDFMIHFAYTPAFPENIDFDEDAYADELLKSIADDFDYTVAKYGTVPKPHRPDPKNYHPDYID